ncbi:MAG: polyamine aminopropyltransferase [Candidatus Margulisiibacteriota bacterium]|jgi:spermidine synthase
MDERVEHWISENQLFENGLSDIKLSLRVKKHLYSKRSDYQQVEIFDTWGYGRVLQLDGVMQTTEKDEFVYHEMITHVPLLTHPAPKKHLVIGGGDGGASREALKHPLDISYLVDIDEDVVSSSKQYLSKIGSEFENPRLKVNCTDGIQFMRDRKKEFDVISVDSTDPIGPAVGLFSKEFYQDVFNALTDDGIMACQSESPFYYPNFIHDLHIKLGEIFPVVRLYTAVIPTYPGAYWSWTLASKKHDPLDLPLAELQQRMARRKINGLKWFSPEIYKSSFILPPFVQQLLPKKK